MTNHDPNLFKKTLTGIRNLGLDASTRSKMMRIARDYTVGKKKKKLMVFLIALIGIGGLGYGVYQGTSSISSGKSSHRSSVASSSMGDFKVPAWMGGTGKPKNLAVGKHVASGNYKAVSKYKGSKKKISAKKGKKHHKYAKKHKGKKSKYAKHQKSKSKKYVAKKKSKKSKAKRHLANR